MTNACLVLSVDSFCFSQLICQRKGSFFLSWIHLEAQELCMPLLLIPYLTLGLSLCKTSSLLQTSGYSQESDLRTEIREVEASC